MGKAIAILSDGGGHSALAVDAISRNAPLAALSEATQSALRSLLGPAAAVQTPVDLAGAADADPRMFARALELLANDPAVGGVLVVGLFGGYAIRFSQTLLDAEQAAATSMCEIAAAQNIPLVVHSLYAGSGSEPLRTLMAAGVPVVQSLETACRCISALHRRGFTARQTWPIPQSHRTTKPNALAGALAEKRFVLLEPEARDLMSAAGVTFVPARWCRTAGEAAAAAHDFQSEVAIKAVSAAASHKTEAGGVALTVSPDDAHSRFDEIVSAVRVYARQRGHDPDLRGALVSPMLPKPIAELLIGVRRDPQFGPTLVVSAGGSAVELFRDSAVNLLPLADPSAETAKRTLNHALGHVEVMLSQIGIGPILAGYRGQPGGDIRGITRVALALADLLYEHPEIESLEINPLFVYPDKVVAVDARGYLMGGAE
jgi:acetyltransferase